MVFKLPAPEGKKADERKLRYDLIPYEALDMIVEVLGHGADKYGDWNWEEVPDGWRRYFAATMRHLTQIGKLEHIDKDSGLHHMAHVGANALFMLAMYASHQRRDT